MQILFFSKYFYPHVGGVEKQVQELSQRLIHQGHQVTVLTLRYESQLKLKETINKIKVIRMPEYKLKYFGLLLTWFWLFRHINILKTADLIHAHSILVWYWPFRFLLPKKPIFTTFHGWEGIYPIPHKNIFIRQIDVLIAWKNIAICDYLEKHYHFKADQLMYTSVDLPKQKEFKKDLHRLVYVGRLDEDTGLPKILQALSYLKGYKIDFCGDGPLANLCRQYGAVHGFVDPNPFYQTAYICLSPGHTSILEAFTYKCFVVTTYNNPVKKDYLLMTPFNKWLKVINSPKHMARAIKYFSANPDQALNKINLSYNWVQTQNWNNTVKVYLNLWQ